MQPTSRQVTREQQAHEEVGVTAVSRRAAAGFVGVWLLLLGGVFVVDHAVELGSGVPLSELRTLRVVTAIPDLVRELPSSGWIGFNRALLREIEATETAIEDEGAVARWIRPWAQAGLWAVGAGNEQAYRGRDGWLVYRAGLDAVTGPGFLDPRQLARRRAAHESWEAPPQPDPMPALRQVQVDLAERGIRLLLLPVPVKPEVAPETFSARYAPGGLARNASMERFLARCREAGIEVLDAAGWLQAYRAATGNPPYLQTDTHWTPEAMQSVAERTAAHIRERIGGDPALSFDTAPATVTNRGDIAAMLDFPAGHHPYPVETATVVRVLSGGGWWRGDPEAAVLLLGDSFSNIYSLEAMGWGEAAGLAEHLALALGEPVDRIVRNDAGAHATRRVLARELARGRDRLAGKAVVVYQFATRELALGDWAVLPLALGDPPPSAFLALDPGTRVEVRGVVREVSSVPRPGTVPYRDHVVSVHLVDLEGTESPVDANQAVVFLRSMDDNAWTAAARLRPGDEITLGVEPWADRADTLGGLNRSELDDLALQLEEPVWGTLTNDN